MRMQIAPLPPVTVGEYTDHPFILILDEVTDEQVDTLSDHAVGHHLKASTGARAVIVLTHTLDVHAALNLNTDEMAQLQAALDRALTTRAGDPLPPPSAVPPGTC